MSNESLILSKWWWRALKVIYIFMWIVSILLLISIAYSARPHKVQNYSRININCNKKENSFNFSPSGGLFTTLDDLNWTKDEEELATKSCEYGLHRNDYAQLPSVARNYTVSLYFDAFGSWNDVFIILSVGLLIAFILIETFKTIILYIIGISIWRGMLLYGLLLLISIFSSNNKPKST